MPLRLTRDEIPQLLEQGAQLVEVLPVHEYEEDHLPGAVSVPLRRIERDARTALDPTRPVIVYCWDAA